MQLEDLRIFVAVADARSITVAANKLSMSKQYVSRRIIALEAEVGVRLLVRNTRRLAVTELGEEFVEYARRITADVQEVERAMSQRRSGLRGALRITAPMSFGMAYLSKIIACFLKDNADVRVDIEFSDRYVDIVGEGYDAALRIGNLADSTLIAQRIMDIRFAVACSPDYLKRAGTPQSPEELMQHACLLYGSGRGNAWEFAAGKGTKKYEVRGPMTSNNGEAIRDAAVAGLGIAFLPRFIVAQALTSGELVDVLSSHLPPPPSLYVVYPQHRERLSPLRPFLAYLREKLEPEVIEGRI